MHPLKMVQMSTLGHTPVMTIVERDQQPQFLQPLLSHNKIFSSPPMTGEMGCQSLGIGLQVLVWDHHMAMYHPQLLQDLQLVGLEQLIAMCHPRMPQDLLPVE